MAKRIIGQNQKSFKDVGKSLRAEGIQFRMNVMECCRGCISHEKLGLKSEDQPYGYTYGGQGGRITWNSEDQVVYADSLTKKYRYGRPRNGELVDSVYVNHRNGSAEKIVEAFRNGGFKAEWDGEDSSCVEIIFAD